MKSGIGAKVDGDDFWPAFGKGALAGVMVYSGKEIASYNGSVPFAGAMGKLVHDLGVSVSDNIMRGDPPLSRYRTDFGPIEFDFNNRGLDIYIYPYPAYAVISEVAKGHKFDFKQTLFNLTPVFSFGKLTDVQQGGYYLTGQAMQNVFNYCRGCTERLKASTISHEMNHVLFFSEFRFLDDLMGKKSDVIKEMPILWPIAPVFDYIKIGPWLAMGLFHFPEYIHSDAYEYSLPEIEACIMQKPLKPNAYTSYP